MHTQWGMGTEAEMTRLRGVMEVVRCAGVGMNGGCMSMQPRSDHSFCCCCLPRRLVPPPSSRRSSRPSTRPAHPYPRCPPARLLGTRLRSRSSPRSPSLSGSRPPQSNHMFSNGCVFSECFLAIIFFNKLLHDP